MSSPTPPCRRDTLPKPWLAALFLLFVALLALSGGNIRDAFAAPNETGGPYRPTATIETNDSCFLTEVAIQNPGGAATGCGPGGYVIYRVPTLQLPADATNVRYRVNFEGYALATPAQVAVSVSPVANVYPVTRYYALGTTKYNVDTPFLSWDGDWTGLNNGQVYVKMARSQGTVYWDNLHLVILYDTPNKADLSVGVNGPGTVLSGSTFEWTVNVSNKGPLNVSNVVLTATAANGLALPPISGCNTSPGYPSCNVGHIVAGGNRTLKFTALAAQDASGPKAISFSVTGGLVDPQPGNNTIARSITVVPSRNVTLCTEWEDNGDNASEATRSFGYIVHHTTPGTDPITLTRSVSEGNTICGTFKTRSETLNILSTSYDGLALAAGYPKWEKFVSGTSGTGTANVAVADWKVTFVVKGKPQAQPTATPTNTPIPNTPTPAPNNTPTPKPTNTPNPTNTPKPTSTPVVPTPAPTQPSQGDAPQPTPANPQDGGAPQQPGGPDNGGNPSNSGGGWDSNSGVDGNDPAETPQDTGSPETSAEGPDNSVPEHPTRDAGGAVSTGPIVTDPTESAPESASPGSANAGGSSLGLFALLAAAVMVLVGLGIVALGRRRSAERA